MCIIFLSLYLLYLILWIYFILISLSSINGNWCHFILWAIEDPAPRKEHSWAVLHAASVLLWIHLGAELLDHKTDEIVFIVILPFYTVSTTNEHYNFSTFLLHLLFSLIFNNSHSSGHYLRYLTFSFLIVNNIELFSVCLLATWRCSWKDGQ